MAVQLVYNWTHIVPASHFFCWWGILLLFHIFLSLSSSFNPSSIFMCIILQFIYSIEKKVLFLLLHPSATSLNGWLWVIVPSLPLLVSLPPCGTKSHSVLSLSVLNGLFLWCCWCYFIVCILVAVVATSPPLGASCSYPEYDSIYLKSVCHFFKHHLQHVNDDFPLPRERANADFFFAMHTQTHTHMHTPSHIDTIVYLTQIVLVLYFCHPFVFFFLPFF